MVFQDKPQKGGRNEEDTTDWQDKQEAGGGAEGIERAWRGGMPGSCGPDSVNFHDKVATTFQVREPVIFRKWEPLGFH